MDPGSGVLSGRSIVLGVTGGIAAYKAAELCRLLVKAGADVRVIMTEAACQFITPLTMQTLSGSPVSRGLFDLDREAEIGHIRLADEADLLIVAPATADAIARLAAGLADDLLAAVVLASTAPVLLAPAMNVNMWRNPLTQANLAKLLSVRAASGAAGPARFSTVGPDRGELACGWIGEGRLIEPAEIAAAAQRVLTPPAAGDAAAHQPLDLAGDRARGALAGRRVVVTAGPTYEAVDAVRFLGNRSSGKMGFALAQAAAARGAEVLLIAGPVALATPPGVGARVDIESAADLARAVAEAAPAADVVVMAAAVADFRPVSRLPGKLSRREATGAGAPLTLELQPNPDILAGLGTLGRSRAATARRPFLVGFAAEMAGGAALLARARAKLAEKGCDAIVANDVSQPGIGFGADDNEATIVFADGQAVALPRASKRALAEAIWDAVGARLGDGVVAASAPVPGAAVAGAPRSVGKGHA